MILHIDKNVDVSAPDEVKSIVKDAEERAGNEFVGMERNLRKIARNRRQLDEKLQKIKHTDKALEGLTERYQQELEDIQRERKGILEEARKEAEAIVKGAGAQVEKTRSRPRLRVLNFRDS